MDLSSRKSQSYSPPRTKVMAVKRPGSRDMLSIYKVEYYSIINRKEALIHGATWMSLENIMLTERSQSHKKRTHIVRSHFMKCPEYVNPSRQKDEWLPEGRRRKGHGK